jgi:hypothetical protein
MLCTNLGCHAFPTVFTIDFLLVEDTNHKPLEWLTTMSNANGRWGKSISMLQDFHFKIVHRLGSKHSNVDA